MTAAERPRTAGATTRAVGASSRAVGASGRAVGASGQVAGPAERRRVVVAGIGSEYRRDDGAGAAVASRVWELAAGACDVGPVVDPLALLGLWDDAELAVVIDAVRSGADAGTVHVVDLDSVLPGGAPATAGGATAGGATAGATTAGATTAPASHAPGPVPRAAGAASTHGIDVSGVLRLARAVGRAPRRVVVVGIEGKDFGYGQGLSPEVARAVPQAVHRVLELISGADICA